MIENNFKIIIPLYNVEKWVAACIRSVKFQDYKNFTCVLIDDISTDNSVSIIRKEIEGDSRFKLIINEQKKYALQNIYEGIQHTNPEDEDIIITLDGDDWLACKNVFSILNDEYEKSKCWITYGSYVEYPNWIPGKFSRQIPQEVIDKKSFREHEWMSSHLRSFKYKLWKNIKKEDFLDNDNNFYRMAWDLSFMFPMLEMAGNKSKYIQKTLYVYNLGNPLNDHKIDNTYQIKLEQEIRNKKKYSKIIPNRSALDLMNANRFDIAAKILYAKNKIRNIDTNFHKELYLQHLKVWNNFEEFKPVKKAASDFLCAFDSILNSIKSNGFDCNKSQIPVVNGTLINGAHRAASCIVLNKTPTVYEADISEGQYMCNYEYFRDKKDFVPEGLDQVYLDEMALEFCRNKSNLYTITLFPSHNHSMESIMSMIRQDYNIIYKKDVILTDVGKLGYIHNLYYKESWIGPKSLNYPGVMKKAAHCFSKGSNLCVFLIEEDNPERLVCLKNKIRKFCGIGNHSIHINDTQEETWRIASSIFNSNSLSCLNNRRTSNTINFDLYFDKYQQIISNRPDKEDFCIDSSAVLSAYGLRDCRDLDFLHLRDVGDLFHKR